MPYTKINPTTKRQALDKLNQGMAVTDVGKMFGISTRTLNTWKQKQGVNSSVPASSSQSSIASSPASTLDENVAQEKPTLDFEDSPTPIEKKSVVDAAWDSLKGMLGIADKTTTATQPILSAKLDAKRQQFVDSVSPTLSLAFVAIAGYTWRRVDAELASYLAPSEDVALKIVTPLVRVYARHANFLTDINPDVADIGAAAFALYGYVDSSIKLYRQLKEEQAEHEENQRNGFGNGFNRGDRWAGFRAFPPTAENGARNQGDRFTTIPGGNGNNGEQSSTNGRYPGSVDIPDLPDKEARQYAALHRLSQLDYEHRARRSGRT